jgi:hypothetical protein
MGDDMTSSPKRTEQVLSFLTPDQCERANGLPGVAIQGVFTDAECSVEGFRVNRAFVEFMHDVIRTTGPTDPSLQEAAAEQGNGWVYIIDLRTPEGPQGCVPVEDIIGGFEVRDGRLLANSYQPNEKHRVLSSDGPVRLPPSLHAALVRAALERGRPV